MNLHDYSAITGAVNKAKSLAKNLAAVLILTTILLVLAMTSIWLFFMTVMCVRSTFTDDTNADAVEEFTPTAEEIELAHTITSEGCDGTNCFVYIADPNEVSLDLYDPRADRDPFLRMLTGKGDDLSFGISEGRVFDATRMFMCKPESKCGIAPVNAGDGIFELVVYDAPRGEHKSYIHPSLKFTMSQKDINSPRSFRQSWWL